MNLLAIETATENCSVALCCGQTVLHRTEVAPQRHAQLVLGFADDLLRKAGLEKNALDGIVFGQGPGAFTGVRIAISLVQGLALDVPVLGVSTLQAVAQQVCTGQNIASGSRILVANDARMGEAYHTACVWQDGRLQPAGEERVSPPQNIELSGYAVYAGSAFKAFPQLQPDSGQVYAEALPTAEAVLALGQPVFRQQAVPVEQARPSYVREQVVQS